MLIISQRQIQYQVSRIAKKAARLKPEVLVMIMTAAFPFASDLLKVLAKKHNIDCQVGYMECHRVGGGFAKVTKSSLPDVSGKNVLLVDCIFDAGATMRECTRTLYEVHSARIVDTACLLWRNDPKTFEYPSFWGFDLKGQDGFWVGYGLDDVDGLGRGLPWLESR